MIVVMTGKIWCQGAVMTYFTARVLIDPVTTIKNEMKTLNCGDSVFIKLSMMIPMILSKE